MKADHYLVWNHGKVYHNICLPKVIDKADIDKTIARKEAFNCPECLISPAKVTESKTSPVSDVQNLVKSASTLMNEITDKNNLIAM